MIVNLDKLRRFNDDDDVTNDDDNRFRFCSKCFSLAREEFLRDRGPVGADLGPGLVTRRGVGVAMRGSLSRMPTSDIGRRKGNIFHLGGPLKVDSSPAETLASFVSGSRRCHRILFSSCKSLPQQAF